MRRRLLSTAITAAVAATAATAALGTGGAGHNPPTRALEAGFKVALYERAGDPQGCYPAPTRLAGLIRKRQGRRTGVAKGYGQVRKRGRVYVVRRKTNCGNVRMALRAREGIYVLDSKHGSVRLLGRHGRRAVGTEPGQRGPLRGFRFATSRASTFSDDEAPRRLQVRCPGGTFPLGGGQVSKPGLGADGEGIYHHSYERLGAQRGWHVTPFLLNPNGDASKPRRVVIQVTCARGLVPMSAPHKTVYIKPGQTKTAIARCPRGQFLMSGGYQRTDFLRYGGDYVTESRAAGPRAWKVTGRAFGAFGGELSAIAYCARHRGPLLRQVRASVPVPAGRAATARTPRCPGRWKLAFGGFSLNGTHRAFIGDAWFVKRSRWATTAYGYFGSAPKLTAYGYCLRPGSAGRP